MYKRIVVPLDGSKVAEAVLPEVKDLAKSLGAEVVLLRVVQAGGRLPGHYVLPPAAAEVLERESTLRARAYLDKVGDSVAREGIKLNKVVIAGPVSESIVDWARKNNVDLIALMSHGLGRAARWVFGSVADRLLQSSPVPLLVVRASQEVLEIQEEYEEEQLDQAILKALSAG